MQSVTTGSEQVVNLMGQFVGYCFTEQGRQQEILHGIKHGGLVEAAFVVILIAENVLSSARWRDGQRLWRWGLMNLGCDGNPPLQGLIDCRKQRRAWYFGRDGREQP